MAFHGGNIYDYNNELLDFSSNINPFGIPPSFRMMIPKHLDKLTQYPDIAYASVKNKIAEYLHVLPKQVVVGNGAVEIIFLSIAMAGCKQALILGPTFSEYREAASQAALAWEECDAFEAGYQKVDLEGLLKKVKPYSMVVICNPNNPTGTLIPRDQLFDFARELAQKQSMLLVDEAFIEFTDAYPHNSMVRFIDQLPNLFVIRAATKFFGMPGIRLGYGVSGNRDLLQKIESQQLSWHINTLAVLAAETIFADENYIERSRQWIQAERSFLYEGLKAVKGLEVYSSQTNFFLARLTLPEWDAWRLRDEMVKKGILIRTPDGFNSLTPQHFRLAVKDRDANVKLIAVLNEVLIK